MAEVSSVIESLKQSIVVVKFADGRTGTGFFLNCKGLLITNKHVIELNTYFKVMTNSLTEIEAMAVFSDNDIDFSFAIAKVDKSIPVPLADSNLLED